MLKILYVLLQAIGNAFGFFKDQRQLNAGNAEQRARDAEDVVDAITKAQAARNDVAANNSGATGTDQLPDDGFRRD